MQKLTTRYGHERFTTAGVGTRAGEKVTFGREPVTVSNEDADAYQGEALSYGVTLVAVEVDADGNPVETPDETPDGSDAGGTTTVQVGKTGTADGGAGTPLTTETKTAGDTGTTKGK